MAARKSVSLTKKDKNPKGGLTASGRAKYNKATGGKLKAPVKGAADTPEKEAPQGLVPRSHGLRQGSAQG
jgi:hypothetical protein